MISVIIPVFNGASYLRQALESVVSQTLRAAEIVVVDDGSSDESAEIAASFAGVRCVRQDHRGPGAARNRGIRESKFELLAFLDADDVWEPEKLALQAGALEDPALDLVFSHMTQFRSPELSEQQAAALKCDERPHSSTLISCMLARRSAFDRVGPLREDTKVEFLDWYLRAREAGLGIRVLEQALVRRRIHPRNFSLIDSDIRRAYLPLLRSSLERRRAKGQSG